MVTWSWLVNVALEIKNWYWDKVLDLYQKTKEIIKDSWFKTAREVTRSYEKTEEIHQRTKSSSWST